MDCSNQQDAGQQRASHSADDGESDPQPGTQVIVDEAGKQQYNNGGGCGAENGRAEIVAGA